MDSPLASDPLDWQLREAEAHAYLEGLREAHGGGLVVDVAVVQGKPAEQICDFVAANAADLTVFTAHGDRGLTGWRLGSTARKLVEGVPGSFLVASSDRVESDRVESYHVESDRIEGGAAAAGWRPARVLVPLDGSVRAESALALAVRAAAEQGAELTLVHVVEVGKRLEGDPLGVDDQDLDRQVLRRNEARAREYLTQLRSRLQGSVPKIRTTVLRGADVRRELSRAIARERPDLLVLAAHGRSGRTEDPAGSVTMHLVGTTSTSTLVLRDRSSYLAWRRRAQRATADAAPPPLDPLAR